MNNLLPVLLAHQSCSPPKQRTFTLLCILSKCLVHMQAKIHPFVLVIIILTQRRACYTRTIQHFFLKFRMNFQNFPCWHTENVIIPFPSSLFVPLSILCSTDWNYDSVLKWCLIIISIVSICFYCRMLWFRSRMLSKSLMFSEVKLLEGDWLTRMLYSSVY